MLCIDSLCSFSPPKNYFSFIFLGLSCKFGIFFICVYVSYYATCPVFCLTFLDVRSLLISGLIASLVSSTLLIISGPFVFSTAMVLCVFVLNFSFSFVLLQAELEFEVLRFFSFDWFRLVRLVFGNPGSVPLFLELFDFNLIKF